MGIGVLTTLRELLGSSVFRRVLRRLIAPLVLPIEPKRSLGAKLIQAFLSTRGSAPPDQLL